MYLIKWIDDDQEKSFVANSWIERDGYIEENLDSKGLTYTVTTL